MSDDPHSLVLQASAVAIEGRALLIEGPPGIGKSSLALALIERGATLIGDDAVTVQRSVTSEIHAKGDDAGTLIATVPPNIEGLLEVRGVGLVTLETAGPTPVALILTLLLADDPAAQRMPHSAAKRDLLSCRVPVLPFTPGNIAPAQRALMALRVHGLGV